MSDLSNVSLGLAKTYPCNYDSRKIMDEIIKCRATNLFEIWGWDDDSATDDNVGLVDEESEVEREPPFYEQPEFKTARSRFLSLWSLAQETDQYYKNDWSELNRSLWSGADPEVTSSRKKTSI
jgi:hypothetical protein